MDPQQSGAQLGELLFGQADPSAYYKGQLVGARTQDAMHKARRDRALAIIDEGRAAKRQQLPDALSGVYTDPKMAALADAVLGSNSTVNLSDLGSILQRPGALGAINEAGAAMDAGDFPAYNQQTALAAGKPYEPVRVAGGNLLPSGVGLGDEAFEVRPLPQTQAQIDTSQARGRAADALAGKREGAPNAPAESGLGVADVAKVFAQALGLGDAAAPVSGEAQSPTPAVGAVDSGYRYIGGPPGDPKSWVKL